jgi:hypothetical protein
MNKARVARVLSEKGLPPREIADEVMLEKWQVERILNAPGGRGFIPELYRERTWNGFRRS